MLFNSLGFAHFFAILFPSYWALARFPRAQNLLLLGAGYYFYACWEPRFLALLVASTLVDYACGLAVDRIGRDGPRRAFVALSMALNLGFLGYFKYVNFFSEGLKAALASAGLAVPDWQIDVALPIGISFYTFQSMSYVIDVYRREIGPTRDLIRFATFVSFFPHLVAGPIMRPTSLLPQVARPRRFDLDQFYRGSYLILWGLVKKVAIADNLGTVVDSLFGRWDSLDGGSALLAVYAFAFQIYGDFSGYTDVARGVANLLGFELARNFDLPYFARNPREFWSKWHISLSEWLRDYLYIPLGGNRTARATVASRLLAAIVGVLAAASLTLGRDEAGPLGMALAASALALSAWGLIWPMRGRAATARNLLLTMTIGGLWHGAAWTFVLWGIYHGLLLVGHRLLQPLLDRVEPAGPIDRACWSATRMMVTFHLVGLGWLFFRARSVEQAIGMLGAIATGPCLPPAVVLVPVLACVVPLLIFEALQYGSGEPEVVLKSPWYVRGAFYAASYYAFVLGGSFEGGQFLYFQF